MTEYPIDIVRSTRRKRTVQASLVNGRIKVMVPAGMDPAEEHRLVDEVTAKVISRNTSSQIDLTERARLLALRYSLPTPRDITWSNRQNTRWGSCTVSERRIRISARLATMPSWVLDSVIVHELAHLEEPNHGPAFHELVNRYELTERARGYLMAMAAA